MIVFVPLLSLLWATSASGAGSPAGTPATSLELRLRSEVLPFIDAHCLSCHGRDKIKGGLDLRRFTTWDSVVGELSQWETIADQLKQGDMPPEDARQPTPEVRSRIVNWISDVRKSESRRHAGDPGVVLARRLSKSEYDYTIADLTGVDLRPAKAFPIDPANEAGFDNTGESLTMSPALLTKHYEAARFTAEHLVLTPKGIAFAPHAVVTEVDRDKYSVNRIVEFYRRQPTDLAAYFVAAWKYKHRAPLGMRDASLGQVAAAQGVSGKYLATIWASLNGAREAMGPVAALQALWRGLPYPGPQSMAKVEADCVQMRSLVLRLRESTKVVVNNLVLKGTSDSAQALVLWKDRQMAAGRRKYGGGALQLRPEQLALPPAAHKFLVVPTEANAQTQFERSFERFARVFPDHFYVSELARVFLNTDEDKDNTGRLLSAGFHNQTGYFRDDGPLYDMVLSRQQQAELDSLWQELDFITLAPLRQHTSLIWFERSESSFLSDPEFDFARSEDKEIVSEEKFRRFAELYYAKAQRTTKDARTLAAVKEHFSRSFHNITWVREARKVAEPLHLQALIGFAHRAYRRPLTAQERDGLTSFYRQLRDQGGRDHEEAVRDGLVSILMSPHFLYHVDQLPKAPGIHPLSDHALASRLSYFLWSSMPDQPLLDAAAAGTLRQPAVLLSHTRRMLKDSRMRNFTREFLGNWLDIRQFEQHNAVDRGHFTSFTNDLRQAMFEEPLRFMHDLIKRNGSVLDLLYGKHTFVNADLARHYGMPHEIEAGTWRRIDDAYSFGRGGVLPMAVFLTKNAPGLRTSPVKRGDFVVQRVLGERIPAPPPDVPELPSEEADMGGLTMREALAKHREDKSCSACHARFDSFGLVFENYGPIGERRSQDLGGRPVDTTASFPDGSAGDGLQGLREYIRTKRQDDFIGNVCRKLLSYALGRGLMPSDDAQLAQMKRRLHQDQYRVGGLFEQVVMSAQFRNKRGADAWKP